MAALPPAPVALVLLRCIDHHLIAIEACFLCILCSTPCLPPTPVSAIVPPGWALASLVLIIESPPSVLDSCIGQAMRTAIAVCLLAEVTERLGVLYSGLGIGALEQVGVRRLL